MAEKRMFAKSIVLSDAFLDMPLSTRCLYFTLGMMADDDGFVGAPKSIMRQCGASQDDLSILIAKRYVLAFDSGVIVIKHWRINNYLRSDRYTETTYLEEKNSLDLDGKGAYTEAGIPPGIPPGIPSIDKERLVEGREDKDREGKDSLDNTTTPTTTRASADAADDELAAVRDFYMENISKAIPSSVTIQAIQGFISELGADLVLHAMKIAAEAEVHDWRYAKRILERYRDSGLKTLEAVQEDEAKERQRKAGWGRSDSSAQKRSGGNRPYGDNSEPRDDTKTMEQIKRLREKIRGGDDG